MSGARTCACVCCLWARRLPTDTARPSTAPYASQTRANPTRGGQFKLQYIGAVPCSQSLGEILPDVFKKSPLATRTKQLGAAFALSVYAWQLLSLPCAASNILCGLCRETIGTLIRSKRRLQTPLEEDVARVIKLTIVNLGASHVRAPVALAPFPISLIGFISVLFTLHCHRHIFLLRFLVYIPLFRIFRGIFGGLLLAIAGWIF